MVLVFLFLGKIKGTNWNEMDVGNDRVRIAWTEAYSSRLKRLVMTDRHFSCFVKLMHLVRYRASCSWQ